MDSIPCVGLLLHHVVSVPGATAQEPPEPCMTSGTRAACSWSFTAGKAARAEQTGHGSQRHSASQLGHQTSVTLANGTRGQFPGKALGTVLALSSWFQGARTRGQATPQAPMQKEKLFPPHILSLCPPLTTATNGLRTCRAMGWTSSRMEKGQELEGRNSAVNDPGAT